MTELLRDFTGTINAAADKATYYYLSKKAYEAVEDLTVEECPDWERLLDNERDAREDFNAMLEQLEVIYDRIVTKLNDLADE